MAGRQHGVITYRQLREAGFSGGMVDRWVGKGLLHRQWRGVYRFGHRAPSAEARYLAAVLACGPGAVLSGRAAAWVHRLLKGAAPPPEVTVCTRREHPGIRVRRSGPLDPRDVRRPLGIPTTSLARTVVDLAAQLPAAELARVFHVARVRYRLAPAAVDAAVGRRPRPPGVERLRAVVHGDEPVVLSRMERRFLAWLRRHGFPRPETNVQIDRGYVDCRWSEHALTVELDSYRYHATRHAWEQDIRRTRAARARGDRHRRYMWADLFEDDAEMLVELEALLPRCR